MSEFRKPDLLIVRAMSTWDKQASIRSKPIPKINLEEVEDKKTFYSAEMAPIANHPLILERGEEARSKVLTLYLLGSTRFTDWIEDQIVIPVSMNLANSALGDLEFSTGLRLDSRRCVVDEAHHSLFTSSIEEEVKAATGVEFETPTAPLFFRKLRRLMRATPTEFRHLIPLGFAICSETLITGTLATLHRDEKVISGIRTMFLDHAQDESRHSALFGVIFEKLLPQLSTKHKQFLLPLFPDFIRWFTEPELGYYRAGLKTLGLDLSASEIDQILAESYPQAEIDKIVLDAARPSVKILEAKGIFADSKIRDAFAERKLIA